VNRPPRSSPHSDIDGVNKGKRGRPDRGSDTGDAEDLEQAGHHSKGRPLRSDDPENRDDRAR
jgi:hypothetical protein